MLKFHAFRILDVRPDADDAIAISLTADAEVRGLYRGLPGQHVVLRVAIDGREVRRTYSVVSAPGEWPLRIVVRIHEGGVMSGHLAEALRLDEPPAAAETRASAESGAAAETLDVLPPNGSLTPRLSSKDRSTYVAFASGCGITPVISIARAVLAADPRNRFILFYGNRNTARAMCLEEVLALKDRNLDRFAIHFVMSREPQEVDLYNGRLDAERVGVFAEKLFRPTQVAEYFVCGPGTLIDDVTAKLHGLGVEPERIHSERFTVESDSKSGGAEPAAGATSAAGAPAARTAQTDVTVLMDGRRRTFTMRTNDETILDAATRAGLDLPFSCRAGVCSTCRTKVVKGHVRMDDNYALEEWELADGYVLACQSRAQTPVLELDYDEK